ncbi:MAG: hypothetical protein HQK66_05735 [Desulfamplus sp.]|nr:hypothetical protein [Desulfamplus sp.]
MGITKIVQGQEDLSGMPFSTVTDKEFELVIKTLTHDLEKLVAITSRVLNRLAGGTMSLDNPRHRSLVASSAYAMERTKRMIADINETMADRKLPLSMESCRLHDLMLRTGSAFAPMADSEGIEFEMEFTGPDRAVSTDPALLTRIVENYLYNALSHAGEKGWIHLKAETEESGAYAVSVTNSGPALPEKDLDRIFHVGVQLDLMKRGQWQGKGLGLAFCRMAATAMGLQVGAENLEGNQGVAFYCRN